MNVSELFQRSYFKWSFELDNLSLIYCAESSVFNLHLQIIMKTFATALILATAEAGNYTFGTVLPGHPGGVNRNLVGGGSGNGVGGPTLVGGVATAGLNTGLGGGSTVLIDSGVDNNEVDATRFADAVQGSRKLAGDVAGKLAGVRLANSLPLSASTLGTYGDTVPVVRGRQVDVTEEQLFT